ncbi:helix-turn-helix domain-containing protein [Cupriavidus necator]
MPEGRFRVQRCAIAGVQAVEASSRRAFGRHAHDQYGIGVIVRGGHRSCSGRGMVEAVCGDIITVNPGEVHDGMPLAEAGRDWRMLYIDPALMRSVAGDLGGNHGTAEFTLPVIRDAALAQRLLRAYAALTASVADAALSAEERLLAMLAPVLRPAERLDAALPAGLRLARERIDDDPAAAVSLGELAALSGLSRYQLVRAFARATGLTPHAYLVQQRIELARRLIAQGCTLADAALASGFADQSHMTRVFSGKYGISPRAWALALA